MVVAGGRGGSVRVSFIPQKPPGPSRFAAPHGTREIYRGQKRDGISCTQLLSGAAVPVPSPPGLGAGSPTAPAAPPCTAGPAPPAPGREGGATSALCLFNLFCTCFRCFPLFCYMQSLGDFCVSFPLRSPPAAVGGRRGWAAPGGPGRVRGAPPAPLPKGHPRVQNLISADGSVTGQRLFFPFPRSSCRWQRPDFFPSLFFFPAGSTAPAPARSVFVYLCFMKLYVLCFYALKTC